MYLSDRNDRYVDLWYIFCVKFSLKKVVDPHVQALSFTLFQFFRLKERQINIGRIDLRPGEQLRAKRPVTTSRTTNTVHIGRIVLSPDEVPLGKTTFGLNELIPIKLFCATIPQPPHTIVSIEINPFIFSR